MQKFIRHLVHKKTQQILSKQVAQKRISIFALQEKSFFNEHKITVLSFDQELILYVFPSNVPQGILIT